MQGMRKIDWLAIAFAALGGVVMGALWLDIRAVFWSVGSATAWEAPLTSATITPIALQTNSSVRAAMTDPVVEESEPTGDHAATCDMPSFSAAADGIELTDSPDGQETPLPIFDDSLPPPEEPLPTYELVDPKPVEVTGPVSVDPLEPSEGAPAAGDDTSSPPTTQIDELLPRFDPLAVPHKQAKDDADEPSDMVGTLEEIIQQMGSAVLRSREFYGDEESRKQYSHDLRRELSREEKRKAPPSPVTPAWCAPPPRPMTSAPLPLPYGSTRHVDTLRDAAGQLDDIANSLERQNLYDRADQLRAAAQELRLDARKTNSGP
jgi:hypothetical protein